MEKIEIIDKDFLEFIKKNSKIHKESLENDLINLTDFQVKIARASFDHFLEDNLDIHV